MSTSPWCRCPTSPRTRARSGWARRFSCCRCGARSSWRNRRPPWTGSRGNGSRWAWGSGGTARSSRRSDRTSAPGARTDEAISLLRELFDGTHEGGVFEPKPRRRIPIMVGGTSEPALRRAATLADEWQAVGLSPEQFAERLARLRELGGDAVRATTRLAWEGGEAGLAQAVEQAHAFADAGAEAVAVWFGSHEGFADRMAEFAQAHR
ncbi:LLM class flavin-dependent oxidoreductase [Allokutzneria sp. A3M-2-11 16]|nr:LLM class flavin-dependent oxidoreductase [Allokutzneria sp. A3M-2-11 16]MCP3805602.1 LLM class flavin-dependent oxidoreductase [Allokutzneria sp. A3M-2-11 16]